MEILSRTKENNQDSSKPVLENFETQFIYSEVSVVAGFSFYFTACSKQAVRPHHHSNLLHFPDPYEILKLVS